MEAYQASIEEELVTCSDRAAHDLGRFMALSVQLNHSLSFEGLIFAADKELSASHIDLLGAQSDWNGIVVEG